MDAHSTLRARWRLAALAAVALSACGGGGANSSRQRPLQVRRGRSSSLTCRSRRASTAPVRAGLLLRPAAERLRLRFDDAREERQCRCNCRCSRAALRAVHRRLEPGARVVELSAQHEPQYSDLVETNDDPRYFEFGRVRQGDPTFYVRARVFKCAYLDRSDATCGAPVRGQLNRRRYSRRAARPERVPVAVHAVQQRRLRGAEEQRLILELS